jgi:TonB family protein
VDVSDILRDRMEPPSGLQRMVAASLVAHAAFGAILLISGRNFIGHRPDELRNIMTISLSGAGEGPRNGGFTPAAARPVQVQAPPEDPAKREPVRPPAAKTPEMVMPTLKPTAKPSKTPPPVVRQAPDEARGRTPTKGVETSAGNALAITAARGQGFGLSTGGGPGTGSTLDVADFCCPGYIATMIDRIRSSWQQNQGNNGDCIIKFTIRRDGQMVDPSVEKSSGSSVLDIAAMRAIVSTRTLNPLPAEFPNSTLTVHLNFQYK